MKLLELLHIKGCGWLCKAYVEGREIYRGEYQPNYYDCLEMFEAWEQEKECPK